MDQPIVHAESVSKPLIFINMFIACIYFSWWFQPVHIGNIYLYALLFFGEVYHVVMAFGFWFTIFPRKKRRVSVSSDETFHPTVDIYIPVVNEPFAVIKDTALAAKHMYYKNHTVYILNDGFVAKNKSWEDVEALAKKIGVNCITRKKPGGAKAGNINHALTKTNGEIIVLFDADMVPHPDFLYRVIPYFTHQKIGFVQSPQYYKNAKANVITNGAWEQQEFFFGPIMRGKDTTNSAFICGTNVAIRRTALTEVGGMEEENIAEDFLTSQKIHQKGWQSHYIPDVLAEGLAPEDLLSYYKQQLRWARGSLEVLFTQNPFFKRGLTLRQRLQYLISALYYFNGVIVLIDILIPLFFLFFGLQPVAATTTSFALFFIPFMFCNLYTLYLASGEMITFRAISFSHASFTLQLMAIISVIFHQKMTFAVTPKQAQTGRFIFLVYPHLLYTILVGFAILVAVIREGINPSVVTNAAWAVFNVCLFLPFITAAIRLKPARKTIPNLQIANI